MLCSKFKQRAFSSSVFSGINQAPADTATYIIKYFFRKGNKIATERHMRQIFKKYAITSSQVNSASRSSLFDSFFVSATPFVGLKTRRKRRGKIVQNKVIALSSIVIKRKSFMAFSSIVCVSGRASKPFRSRFFSELNTLSTYSSKRNSGLVRPMSPFFEKRALLYQTAYTARGSSLKAKNLYF